MSSELLRVALLLLYFFLLNAFLLSDQSFTLSLKVLLRNSGSNSLLYALTCVSSSWCALLPSLTQQRSSLQDKASRDSPCPIVTHCHPPWPCSPWQESRMDAGNSVLLTGQEALFTVDQKNIL